MAFTLFIIGNGLGMAIDPDYFPLRKGIESVWPSLEEDLKEAIKVCCRMTSTEFPCAESELEYLHTVAFACDAIRKVDKSAKYWLTKQGRQFPTKIKEFLHRVAYYFHRFDASGCQRYNKFLESFCQFIENNNTHVATLNYDNLLYGPFVDRNICDGYSGYLIDGMWSSGFDEWNLERASNREDLGWYLHLHGSPLFYTHDNVIRKLQRNEDPLSLWQESNTNRANIHLVLSSPKDKASLISGSPLLNSYWNYFQKAVIESEKIVVFGYGGLDDHINDAVAKSMAIPGNSKKVFVVERKENRNSRSLWEKRFNISTIELLVYENILDLDFAKVV